MSRNFDRREILKRSGTATVGAAIASISLAQTANASKQSKTVKVSTLKDIKPLTPVEFSYPSEDLAVLIDMDKSVDGGIGPKKSIVAYSGLCQHRGCPVGYEADKGLFVCPCHRSVFDPARGGDCLEGPSQRGLPRVTLNIRDGAVYAVGIENGPVFGRACNSA